MTKKQPTEMLSPSERRRLKQSAIDGADSLQKAFPGLKLHKVTSAPAGAPPRQKMLTQSEFEQLLQKGKEQDASAQKA